METVHVNAEAEERVKPCLECGTILPFDAEICSSCGTRAQSGKEDSSRDEEPVKPCLACGALIGEEALFCPECGDFTLSVRGATTRAPPIGAREGGLAAALSRAVAILVFVSALAMLFAIVLDYVQTRRALLGG